MRVKERRKSKYVKRVELLGDRGRRVNQGARPRMFETVRVTNLSETSPKAAIFEARGNDGGRLPVSRTRKRHEKQKKSIRKKKKTKEKQKRVPLTNERHTG